MIRVLIVEDSLTARALLVRVLQSDPEIEIVGEASDGIEGVALTQKLRPDVVTMDIQMPRLDGFAATKEIMITAPTPIVIVTGSTSHMEVGVAMNALRAGAVAILHKPRGPRAPDFDEVRRKLVSTVKAMAGVKVVRHWRRGEPAEAAPARSRGAIRDQVVGIVTSTGGPAALQAVLSGLPHGFPVPILVVQHITRGFTNGLADWLNTVCDLRVKVAEMGEPLAPGTVYIAPDDHHLGVSRQQTIALADSPPIGGFRPAGTHLFESLARSYGGAVTAVILTGMGTDGVAGLHAVRKAGGRIIAQDEDSSVVFGMPSAAIAEKLPDLVLPIEEIASRLVGPL
jgi:two-component system, chemotaxis family, protein-glutamate methylesterase/glutaminase